MTTYIVYGPQGCGKTRNSRTLAAHFNCTSIVDEWLEGMPLTKGALHLTVKKPSYTKGVTAIAYEKVAKGAKPNESL